VNTRSLKFRLVAWYAGWLTVVFIVFGFFVYASLDYYLEKSLREALFRRARQVADTVQRSTLDPATLGLEIKNHFAPEANNRFTRATRNQAIVYISGSPADRSFDPEKVPVAPESAAEESFGHRRLPDGQILLVVVVSRMDKTGRLMVEEGFPTAPMEATLHAWLMALMLGLALLVLVAMVGGAVLVQRALHPVGRIIRSAEQISSRNLSERLPVPDTHDEIEHLSTAINQMICRLDEGFQQSQRFFADASHELRTPLTIIQGELEAVAKNDGASPEVRETAGSTLEEVERLKNIVEGLFALSRLDAGEAQKNFEPFDLGRLASTTADQMGLLAEDKRISISCQCADEVQVTGTRSRVKQVVVNLLDNAIKYTPDGGHIEVRVTKRNGVAILRICDNGIGIPAEALPRIFERFFRVDKARSRESGGAGLGLSIVKSICAAHDGRVEVESREGEGACFTVELPTQTTRIS
jgi:heavy metal sensor kinase